jgi:hypothetical protein
MVSLCIWMDVFMYECMNACLLCMYRCIHYVIYIIYIIIIIYLCCCNDVSVYEENKLAGVLDFLANVSL